MSSALIADSSPNDMNMLGTLPKAELLEPSKICVVMWYDSNISEYADINFLINKLYCKKYGYRIIKSSLRRTQLHPTWERAPLMIEALNYYKYVIWIDSDAIFLKDSPPITNVICEYPDKLFILSADVYHNCDTEINAGFIIAKHSPDTITCLREWHKNPDISANGEAYHVLDQGALRYMYDKNICNMQSNSVVIPYGILQSFPNYQDARLSNINKYGLTDRAFVAHMAGTNKDDRVKFATLYLKHNFPKICKCGFIKDANKPLCCLMCANNMHGPKCSKRKI